MATTLDTPIKRALRVGRDDYTLTLDGAGFTLALKGRRIGLTVKWADLVSGEAALANALNASLTANIRKDSSATPPRTSRHAPRRVARN